MSVATPPIAVPVAHRTARTRVHELLESARPHDHASRAVDVVILALITANVVALILETVAAVGVPFARFFHAFEALSIGVFTVEYALRLWSSAEDPRYRQGLVGRLRYARSPLAVVDLLAVLPFYLALLPVDLRFLRVMRVLRVFRLAKLVRYAEALQALGRVLRAKKEELLVSVYLLTLLLILASCAVYYAEHAAQPDAFSSIPAAMWWGIATLTTVGYGDMYPITAIGRLCASLIAVLGIGMVALPAGILGSGFVSELGSRRRASARSCPHCGEALHPE
jgi:voltage-gated potassium channel